MAVRGRAASPTHRPRTATGHPERGRSASATHRQRTDTGTRIDIPHTSHALRTGTVRAPSGPRTLRVRSTPPAIGHSKQDRHPSHRASAADGNVCSLQACAAHGECGQIAAVGQPISPRLSGPPRNPGVRELVAGKRRWSSPPRRDSAMLGFRAGTNADIYRTATSPASLSSSASTWPTPFPPISVRSGLPCSSLKTTATVVWPLKATSIKAVARAPFADRKSARWWTPRSDSIMAATMNCSRGS